jgi:hypothetical protein
MSHGRPSRGGAPVGFLAELDPVEAAAVLYLRLWCEGAPGERRIGHELDAALGPQAGQRALCALRALCGLCVRHRRRPLMRHEPDCVCLGADEACFANLVGAAAAGDREDAILIGTLLVRADMALHLVNHAEQFGLALRRMALRSAPVAAPAPHAAKLH